MDRQSDLTQTTQAAQTTTSLSEGCAMRTCKMCGQIKPMAAFPFNNGEKKYRRHQCWVCVRKIERERVQRERNAPGQAETRVRVVYFQWMFAQRAQNAPPTSDIRTRIFMECLRWSASAPIRDRATLKEADAWMQAGGFRAHKIKQLAHGGGEHEFGKHSRKAVVA